MSSLFRKIFAANKPLIRELNKTYGLSFFKSRQLLKKFGLHKNCLVTEVSEELVDFVCKTVETSFLADIDLKKNYMASTRRCASLKNHHGVFLKIKLKKDDVA